MSSSAPLIIIAVDVVSPSTLTHSHTVVCFIDFHFVSSLLVSSLTRRPLDLDADDMESERRVRCYCCRRMECVESGMKVGIRKERKGTDRDQ